MAKCKVHGVKHHETKVLPSFSNGGPIRRSRDTATYGMSPKKQGEMDRADRDKMQIYGDDIDEAGKPKFNTPEYGYELPSMQDRAARKARNT
jgi:hypothetical protein